MYAFDPPATPDEIAAIVAVLEATHEAEPERTARPSAWRAAAMREAIAPFESTRGNLR